MSIHIDTEITELEHRLHRGSPRTVGFFDDLSFEALIEYCRRRGIHFEEPSFSIAAETIREIYDETRGGGSVY